MKLTITIRTIFFSATICFFIFQSAFPQSPVIQWQQTFGGSNYDQAESIKQTFDGNYIVAGISTSNNGDVTGNHGFGDVWVAMLDSLGSIIWQHAYGGTGDESAFAIEQTSDSGFIVAGSSTSSNGDVTANHGFADCWIIKLSNTGFIQWQKSFGGSGIEIAYDIHQTNDLGYIFAGYTNSTDGDISANNGFDDYWIVKLDNSGNLQWEKTFGGTAQEQALSIIQCSDGNYIAAGFASSSDGDVTNHRGAADYWLVKVDSMGALMWERSLGGTLEDKAYSIAETTESGFIVAGFTASSDSDVTFNHGFEDVWLVKTDSLGFPLWEKSFGGTGVDHAYAIRSELNGNYSIAGSSYSLDGDVSGNHGGYDFWIFQTDSAGSILWNKSLGGSSVEEANSIAMAGSDKIIVAGGSSSTDGDITSTHGDFDYWVVVLDSISGSTNISDISFDSGKINLFPNPSSDETHLYFNLPNADFVSIKIFNVVGQEIRTPFNGFLSAGSNEIKLQTADLKKGIYICEVKSTYQLLRARLILH